MSAASVGKEGKEAPLVEGAKTWPPPLDLEDGNMGAAKLVLAV